MGGKCKFPPPYYSDNFASSQHPKMRISSFYGVFYSEENGKIKNLLPRGRRIAKNVCFLPTREVAASETKANTKYTIMSKRIDQPDVD